MKLFSIFLTLSLLFTNLSRADESTLNALNCELFAQLVEDDLTNLAESFGLKTTLYFARDQSSGVANTNSRDPLFWASASHPRFIQMPHPCIFPELKDENLSTITLALYRFVLIHEFAHKVIDQDQTALVSQFMSENSIPVPETRSLVQLETAYEAQLRISHHSNVDLLSILILNHFGFSTEKIGDEFLNRQANPDETFRRRCRIINRYKNISFGEESRLFKITHLSGIEFLKKFLLKEFQSDSWVSRFILDGVSIKNDNYVIFNRSMSNSDLNRFMSH